MALFFICIDSPEDGQRYSDLLTHLDLLGAKRVLSSVWALKTNNHTPTTLEHLLGSYFTGSTSGRLLIVQAENLKWFAIQPIFDPNDLL